MVPVLLAALHTALAFPAAPTLAVDSWVTGEPITIPREGTVIVELWATWCGPCIDAMPHLSELAEQYDGQVAVAAVSDESVRTVRSFMSRRGKGFAFSTGVDPSGKTTRRFQAIDQAGGIPRTYIVDDGEVVWSGHPMQIDPVLAAVVGDRWTAGHAERYRTLPKLYESYFADINGSAAGRAAETGAELLQYGDLYPGMLNNFSWLILTEVSEQRRDVPLALAAAEKVCAMEPDNAAYLDTLAVALYQSDRLDDAIAAQERAVSGMDEEDPARLELEERLTEFRRQRAAQLSESGSEE